MESPSSLSSFFPTSSSTLLQQSCTRLLWLPLSACLKMAGEHVRNLSTSSSLPPLSQQSVMNSFARSSGGGASMGFSATHTGSEAEDDLVSGFELRFKHACMHCPSLPMRCFQECFLASVSKASGAADPPAAKTPLPPHYRDDARLHFLIGEDAGASQWENMDTHRVIHGVIVVVNTSSVLNVSLAQVLEVVRTVFQAQYKGRVCRCYVVTGSTASVPPATAPHGSPSAPTPSPEDVAKLLANFPPRMFVAVDTAAPVDVTAAAAMEDIGRNVVFTLNATLNQLDSSLAMVGNSRTGKGKIDLTLLRTPLDMHMGGGGSGAGAILEGMKANLVASRLDKKKGDVLVHLGAIDSALRVFGGTQFASNADALWCSATLESIAGARYRQWAEQLAPKLPSINETVVQLQSDTAVWGDKALWEPKLAQIEETITALCGYVQQTISCFKGPCVPNSMRQRLVKEVDEPLTAKMAQLTTLLTRARACVEAGTNELPSDPYAYRVGTDLKLCVEEMLRLGLNEIDIYLKESLRQQRHVTTAANKKTLQDRDLETRLKSVAFLVDRGATEAFVNELSDVRALFNELYGDVVQKVLRFFTLLCIRCRCRRKAIAFLVETAYNDRKGKLYGATIQSLVRACFLSGIALGSIPELNAAIQVDPLCRLYAMVSSYPSATRGFLSASTLLGIGHSGCGGGDGAKPCSTPFSQGDDSASGTSPTAAEVSTLEASFYAAVSGAAELHPEQGTSKRNELALTSRTMRRHIPLLLELLHVLHEADCRGSARCQLATLLLFRYPSYLNRNTSQLLTDIARSESLRLEPHVRPATAELPFLSSWEALSLPPNLAPKTVSVGGPFFTFIDTQRLKLTVLSLNGRRLNSRVVWCLGDVGTVIVSLWNPYHWPIKLLSVALQSRSCSDLDEENRLPPGATSHTTGPLAPTCYVLSNVLLPSFSKTRVLLQVLPKMPGYLRIEGVQLRPEHLKGATLPVQGKLPEPMGIPVLQQLPLVSCTVSVSELEVFSGQCIDFTVRVVNCGQLPIAHISLTAHGEACQLEDCEGCKERASSSDSTVALNKAALEAARRAPLQPGDVVTIPVHLQAPPTISVMGSHFVIFRVDCSLPHEKPSMPPNVPSAVPVFGVIPRRVTETRMRVFHAPTLAVTSVRLTKDKRFVDVRLINRSERYSVELSLSSLPFSQLPDALLMAGADYVVPPIDISRVSDHGMLQGSFLYRVPWAVREIPHCTGTLDIDLSLVSDEVVCSEPLDELLVSIDVVVPPMGAGDKYMTTRHWQSRRLSLGSPQHHHHHHHRRQQHSNIHISRERETRGTSRSSSSSSASMPDTLNENDHEASAALHEDAKRSAGAAVVENADGSHTIRSVNGNANGNSMENMPIVLPAVTPIQLYLQASADWRRAVPLNFSLSMTNHLDVGVLSGPVESVALVGEQGKCVCEQRFELLAFKTGEHALTITVKDSADREIAHVMRFVVQHVRD